MMLHHNGPKKLDNPGVLVSPKILVCSYCGFSQFFIPNAELAMLATILSSEHLTMAQVGGTPSWGR
jgi:hypothetical protein